MHRRYTENRKEKHKAVTNSREKDNQSSFNTEFSSGAIFSHSNIDHECHPTEACHCESPGNCGRYIPRSQ